MVLSLTGCTSGSSASSSTTPSIYLGNTVSGNGEILGYPLTATGSVTATTTLTTPSAPINRFTFDSAGRIYTMTSQTVSRSNYAYTLNAYPKGVTGTATPARTITGTITTSSGDNAFAADSSGNMYVCFGATLMKYTSTATGAAAPALTLTLPDVTNTMTTDAAGDLYVAANGGVITVFNAGFTTSTPARTITPASFVGAYGIAVDTSGNLYLNGAGTVDEIAVFSSTAGANAVPTRIITGSLTTLSSDNSGSIGLDSLGNIYVRNLGTANATVVDVFSSTASGNVAPSVITMTDITNGGGMVIY